MRTERLGIESTRLLYFLHYHDKCVAIRLPSKSTILFCYPFKTLLVQLAWKLLTLKTEFNTPLFSTFYVFTLIFMDVATGAKPSPVSRTIRAGDSAI